MVYAKCHVHFLSTLALQEVADLISNHLLAGIKFIPTAEFDEDPGVRLEFNLWRLSMRITGMTPAFSLYADTDIGDEYDPNAFRILDLGEYVSQCLRKVPSIEVVSL
jgi:hypothetical protein